MQAETFYKENNRLVHAVAQKGYGRLVSAGCSMEYDDLFQDLSEIFLKSVKGFDPERQIKFSTYFTNAAYKSMNQIIERETRGRLQYGLRSFEELNLRMSPDGSEDGPRIEDTIPDDRETPHGDFERKHRASQLMATLSPRMKIVLKWLEYPPQFIIDEIEAVRAHVEFAKTVGITKKLQRISIVFILNFLEKLGMSRAELTELRQEVTTVNNIMEAWDD